MKNREWLGGCIVTSKYLDINLIIMVFLKQVTSHLGKEMRKMNDNCIG